MFGLRTKGKRKEGNRTRKVKRGIKHNDTYMVIEKSLLERMLVVILLRFTKMLR